MQTVVYNEKQLEVIIGDMFNRFYEYKSLDISYDKPYKEKTLKQLGYFFGGLVSAVKDYYHSLGDEWEVEDIKENFYQACSKLDERLIKEVRRFNGDVYQVPKRLSEMDIEEASNFIDKSVWLIDNAKCFKDLILHPSLRYTWIRHISKDDILEASKQPLPRICPEYLEHTRKQACLCCGVNNHSQVHHIKLTGLSGTAYKADDWACIPLCEKCHLGELHQKGQEEFYKNLEWITKYISLLDFCRIRFLKWKYKK